MPRRPSTKSAERVVLYAHVAHSHQQATWLAHQLEACRRFANKHGLSVVQEFTDRGLSDTDIDRPALRQMFDYLDTHHIDYVVCEEMATLARDYQRSAQLVLRVQDHGSKVALASLDAILDIHLGNQPDAEHHEAAF